MADAMRKEEGQAAAGRGRLTLWALILGAAAVGVFLLARSSLKVESPRLPETPAKHVVMVVFDTLRADRMSIYGHDRPTTPYLESISHTLLRYKNATAPAPWTVPSHASIFTGKWPSEHRTQWGNVHLDSSFVTLAEALKAQGFCTMGFSVNTFLEEATGLVQGFDRFQRVRGPKFDRTARALKEMNEALNWASTGDCRLFTFLNVMNTHIPYYSKQYGEEFGLKGKPPISVPATKWRFTDGSRKFGPRAKKRHQAAYDAAVRTVDDVARDVIQMLHKKGMLDDTLLVMTSDHGDGLGFHPELGHSVSVWEEQLNVPLLVRFPGGEFGGEVYEPRVSTVGIPLSVMSWLGVKAPPEWKGHKTLEALGSMAMTADYRNYFGESERKWNQKMAQRYPNIAARSTHQHAVFCGDHKLVVKANGERSLYDLSEDPNEQQDLYNDGGEALAACEKTYVATLAEGRLTPFDAPNRPATATSSAPDGETEKLLEALGYLVGEDADEEPAEGEVEDEDQDGPTQGAKP